MPAVHAAAVHQHAVQAEQVAHAAVRVGRQEAPIARVQVQLVRELVAVVDLHGERARLSAHHHGPQSPWGWLGVVMGTAQASWRSTKAPFVTQNGAWSFAHAQAGQ